MSVPQGHKGDINRSLFISLRREKEVTGSSSGEESMNGKFQLTHQDAIVI